MHLVANNNRMISPGIVLGYISSPAAGDSHLGDHEDTFGHHGFLSAHTRGMAAPLSGMHRRIGGYVDVAGPSKR